MFIPIAVGIICFSYYITGDLYGDEVYTYYFSVMEEPAFLEAERAATSLIFLTLARAGYFIVGAPWGIRLASVLFGIATVMIVGQLAKLLLGEKYTLIAMWLASLSPMLIEFGGEARVYVMLAFWGTAFLLCLVKFVSNENWKTAILLGIVSALGCLTQITFAANLVFGAIYYLVKRRRLTKYAIIVILLVIPVFIRALILFLLYYESIGTKLTAGPGAVVTSNFILRIGLAFNFGYCTFSLPDLGLARNVPIISVLKENLPVFFMVLIASVGIGVGAIQFARKSPKTFFFLLGYIILPSAGIVIIGQLGYTIIREKYLIGVLGAYLILLSAIFKELTQKRMGWIPVLCFALVIGISLYHYLVLPEEYSRRMMTSALNQEIISMAEKSDTIVTYHMNGQHLIPLPFPYYQTGKYGLHYYTFLDKGYNFIDINDEIPEGLSLQKFADQIDRKGENRIFLISVDSVQNWIDPERIVMKTFERRRELQGKRFGRNLKLYIFSKPR